MEELKREHPEYAGVEIRRVEERREREFAKGFDYYYVPSFYVDGVKLHEGVATRRSSNPSIKRRSPDGFALTTRRNQECRGPHAHAGRATRRPDGANFGSAPGILWRTVKPFARRLRRFPFPAVVERSAVHRETVFLDMERLEIVSLRLESTRRRSGSYRSGLRALMRASWVW
jgi:hypothetical protein